MQREGRERRRGFCPTAPTTEFLSFLHPEGDAKKLVVNIEKQKVSPEPPHLRTILVALSVVGEAARDKHRCEVLASVLEDIEVSSGHSLCFHKEEQYTVEVGYHVYEPKGIGNEQA